MDVDRLSQDVRLRQKGFALLETTNSCPSYTVRLNPDKLTPRVMQQFFASVGVALGIWSASTDTTPFHCMPSVVRDQPRTIPVSRPHRLEGAVRLRLAASAGECVRSSAEIFASAPMRAGLESPVREDYLLTVRKGPSCAFVRLSSAPILSPASDAWDEALAATGNELADLRSLGKNGAAFRALTRLLHRERWFPLAALRESAETIGNVGMRNELLAITDAEVAS
jgi:hypothetical protein